MAENFLIWEKVATNRKHIKLLIGSVRKYLHHNTLKPNLQHVDKVNILTGVKKKKCQISVRASAVRPAAGCSQQKPYRFERYSPGPKRKKMPAKNTLQSKAFISK